MSGLSVAETKDQEVAELVFLADDATEAWGLSHGGAEVGPESEDFAAGKLGLGDDGGGSGLQSRAEVSRELVADGRLRKTQGRGCG